MTAFALRLVVAAAECRSLPASAGLGHDRAGPYAGFSATAR
ncbi:hypothetical protein [Amycolatopsis sp. NPDC004169]